MDKKWNNPSFAEETKTRYMEKLFHVRCLICSWGTRVWWYSFMIKWHEQTKPHPRTDNVMMDKIPTKINGSTCLFSLYCSRFWRYILLIKIFKMVQPPYLLFLFFLTFASADIIFHKFLEFSSTFMSEKKKFVTNFPFLTDSLNHLTT